MNRKQLIIGVIIAGVAAIAFLMWSAKQNRIYSANVYVEAAPSDSKITLGDSKGRQGNNKVKPGRYTITFTRSGFTSQSKTVIAAEGKTVDVKVALESNSPETADWYLKHPDDAQKSEGISSKNFDDTSQKELEAQPFIKKLPFIAPGFEFRIDYGTTPEGAKYPQQPGIYIQASSEEAKQDALTWIVSQGFDPEKMNIVYSAP